MDVTVTGLTLSDDGRHGHGFDALKPARENDKKLRPAAADLRTSSNRFSFSSIWLCVGLKPERFVQNPGE